MKAFLARMRSGGLRARLLGIVLLAVLPLAAIMFAYAGTQNTAAQQRARSDVQSRLQSDVTAIRDTVDQSRATLETFSVTYAIQSRAWSLAQGNADRLRTLHSDYLEVAFADPTGRIIVSSTDSTGTVNVSGFGFFSRAVSTGGLVVSNVVTDPQIHRKAICISYPAYDSQGRLIGVEYVALDLATFRARLHPAPSVDSAEALIDSSGTVVARKPALTSMEGRRLPDSPLVRLAIEQKTGSASSVGFDGVRRDYFLAPVFPDGEGEMYIASGYSPSTLLAGQQRLFGMTLLGFGGVSLFALVAAWLLGTFSVYQPMRRLGEAATKLSEGDLTARSGLDPGAGEIGALSAAFDEMAAAIERQVSDLENARTELRALNIELEERVRRRTADLEASNKELEAFNYSVSHDLRAPLRAIDGFSQALLEDYADKFDEEGRDDLQRVKAAANRMGELIDSLLALSRLTRVEMDVREIDLSDMARQAISELRLREPEREVTVSVQPGVVAQADPALVRSVLENLLGNAWKFTARTEAARIEFGVMDAGEERVYFVKDNGAGFDMAYSDKLFGAFQRLHDQKEFPGTGVGLATVARVVHRHGGRVWAEGHPGEGATFYFTLR